MRAASQRIASADVQQIAFFRPSAVGDFVFALPCLATLKARYPNAQLVYIGKQWHQDFLAGRDSPVDEVQVLPACEGIHEDNNKKLNPADSDHLALERFIAALRERRFDLAIQAFGGGRYANPFIRHLNARLSLGWRASEAPPLDLTLPFHERQNRRLQLLELATLAGADSAVLSPGIQITPKDHIEAALAVPDDGQPLLLLQPGASDPRRCWPAEKFAKVADSLGAQGMKVAVNGTAAERPVVLSVISAMQSPGLDLAGRLSLGGLCALLSRSTLLVSNDTGPLHLATEIGTPAVGIYWLTNLIESLPLRQRAHRAAWAIDTRCPDCGMDNLHQRCVHQSSFVSAVSVDEVLSLAGGLLSEASPCEIHP